MRIKYMPFVEQATKLVSDSFLITDVITAALAFATANVSQMPTSSVDSPAEYFNTVVKPSLNGILGEWNEETVFNVRESIEQCRMFWMLRYTAAYPTQRPIYSYDLGFFETMFGVSTVVPAELQAFLHDNKFAVLALASKAITCACGFLNAKPIA